MVLDNKGIRTNSRVLSEIENAYFRFTKCVERDPKMDVNGILARVNNNGHTLFNCASVVSERVAKDILERNICVNYLTTRMAYPNFKYASLTQLLLDNEVNPFIYTYDTNSSNGMSHYVLYKNRFSHIKRKDLQKFLYDQNGNKLKLDPNHEEKTIGEMPLSNPGTCVYYSIHPYKSDDPNCGEFKFTEIFVPYLGMKGKKDAQIELVAELKATYLKGNGMGK